MTTPEWMIAWLLAAMVLAIILGIIPFTYVSIKQSGNARLLQSVTSAQSPSQYLVADRYKPWAQHFRFEWIGGFVFRGLDRRFIAAWRHETQPLFLLVQVVKGATHYELVSVFNREQWLTTTSHSAIVAPNPPGAFVQRFPDALLPEMFHEHCSAHEFLLTQGHVKLVPFAARVDRCIVDGLARTHDFVTAMPAWPLRALAWVLFAPRRMRNLGVAAQLQHKPGPHAAAPPEHAKPAAASAANHGHAVEDDEDGSET